MAVPKLQVLRGCRRRVVGPPEALGSGQGGKSDSRPAMAFLAAAGVAALARAIEPFDHGIWLVAYLFLVGFAAQFLLRRGEAALLASSQSPRAPGHTQVVLWNAGSVAVPVGVLADARLLVVLGAICFLAALALFWRSFRRSDRAVGDRRVWLRRGYVGLLVFMAASTVVGTALAWDTPWY